MGVPRYADTDFPEAEVEGKPETKSSPCKQYIRLFAGVFLYSQQKLIGQLTKVHKKKAPNVAIYRNFRYLCIMERSVLYYKSYFIDFYNSLEAGAQRKIAYVISYIKSEKRWNEGYVKFIRNGIFELRAIHNGNTYRVFFIIDEGNIILLLNGFQKKTQKTPRQEIEKAIKLKEEYYASK